VRVDSRESDCQLRHLFVAPRHHVPRGRAARTRRPNRAGHGKDRGARGRLPGMSGLSGRSRHGRQDLSHMLPATVWLAIACVVVITALFSVLAAFLVLILRELEAAGGSSTSLIAKIRLGRRAIETQAGHVPREVPTVNERMAQLAVALATVDANLSRLTEALKRRQR